jgi:hypothetical protein
VFFYFFPVSSLIYHKSNLCNDHNNIINVLPQLEASLNHSNFTQLKQSTQSGYIRCLYNVCTYLGHLVLCYINRANPSCALSACFPKQGSLTEGEALSKVDLFDLTSLDQLLFKLKYSLAVYQTSYLNEEVNCTEPSPNLLHSIHFYKINSNNQIKKHIYSIIRSKSQFEFSIFCITLNQIIELHKLSNFIIEIT